MSTMFWICDSYKKIKKIGYFSKFTNERSVPKVYEFFLVTIICKYGSAKILSPIRAKYCPMHGFTNFTAFLSKKFETIFSQNLDLQIIVSMLLRCNLKILR